jgi:hypothetical protein
VPWRGPDHPGELPTLGFDVLDWIAGHLIVPDGPGAGEPLFFTEEQAQFVLNFYAVDPVTGKRRIRRGVLSRPKGWGKSPVVGALCIVEALAPVVPDGWDADGEPVGRPWTSLGFKAKTQVVAVSEDQTTNTWDPILEMIREGPLSSWPGVEALDTFVTVPRGRIDYTTSSAVSREGFRPVFAAMDQTESWTASNGGHKLAATIRRNLTKTGGASLETPNAFVPGESSVAEKSREAWVAQTEGRLNGDEGILYDHREAPATVDIADRESLLDGLRFAYGDSTWVQLERVLFDFWDPATDPADGRRFFLNQITSASDAWLSAQEWALCADPTVTVAADKELVTLGFDGSVRDDATAVVACRVEDGHLWLLGCWEKRPDQAEWQVPREEVDAVIANAFEKFDVALMFGDPPHWQDYMDRWTAEHGSAVREWWTNRPRAMVAALERFYTAVRDTTVDENGTVLHRELSHDGGSVLTRHVLNARRRVGRSGLTISKEHPQSDRKIDAAMAAVLAYEARAEAIEKGMNRRRSRRAVGF